jgi:hypothetical protein
MLYCACELAFGTAAPVAAKSLVPVAAPDESSSVAMLWLR